MTDSQRLANIRERLGPAATRVGDPPTAADVELLLRLLDQPKYADDATVAEIRERAQSHRAMDRTDRTMYAAAVIDAMLDDLDTLLAALDAERAAVVAWLRKESQEWQADADNAASRQSWGRAATSCNRASVLDDAADAITRGEHREGREPC